MVIARNNLVRTAGLLSAVCAFFLAAAPILAADPDAADLLEQSLRPPSSAYEGRITVTHWAPKHTVTEEADVRYAPPNRYQWTFLNPDGSVARVVVSDGEQEEVLLPGTGRSLVGDAVGRNPKRLSKEDEWGLLRTNYSIVLDRSDTVVGRPVWIISLTPRESGKPIQRVALDQETDVVLEARRFRPSAHKAVMSRFTRINYVPQDEADRFDFVVTRGGTYHGFDPDFLSLDELRHMLGRNVQFPKGLPRGFVFESADVLTLHGKSVSQVRYTDGLSTVSVFETDKPIRSKQARAAVDDGLVEWRSHGRYFALIGDLSDAVLNELSQSLR